jgi:hypothetical protein
MIKASGEFMSVTAADVAGNKMPQLYVSHADSKALSTLAILLQLRRLDADVADQNVRLPVVRERIWAKGP